MSYLIRQQFLSMFLVTVLWSVACVANMLNAEIALFYEQGLESFTQKAYQRAVHQLLAAYERGSGKPLVPGPIGAVALKLDSRRGLGHAPPRAMVEALIDELVQRGFARDRIYLVDQRIYTLRQAGFLPPLSVGGNDFLGSPVTAWYTWKHVDPMWYYDHSLRGEAPPEYVIARLPDQEEEKWLRHSFLPYLLIEEVDFWINLPVFAHFPVTGFSGALVNASLFNITNEERFMRNPINAPVAVAEINAIPEIREKMRFSLVSLERYQYEGGPLFNANYSSTEPVLWLSTDPVALDAAGLEKINTMREVDGFKPFDIPHPVLDYAERLGVGTVELKPQQLESITGSEEQ